MANCKYIKKLWELLWPTSGSIFLSGYCVHSTFAANIHKQPSSLFVRLNSHFHCHTVHPVIVQQLSVAALNRLARLLFPRTTKSASAVFVNSRHCFWWQREQKPSIYQWPLSGESRCQKLYSHLINICCFVCPQVLNSGPSRSLNTVVDITLPKILTPYKHRLLKVVDLQVCPILVTAVVLAVV